MRPYGMNVRNPWGWIWEEGVQTKRGGSRKGPKSISRRAQNKSARHWAKAQIRKGAE